MRWLLAATMMLAGCSSDPAADASEGAVKTCANTSCVEGASCLTTNGSRCTCFETGVWTCGEAPSDSGGFTVDSAPPPTDSASGPSRTLTGCGATDACADDAGPVTRASTLLHQIMIGCGAYCMRLTLSSDAAGCAYRIVANSEWTEGDLDCIAKEASTYRWICAASLTVETSSCPE